MTPASPTDPHLPLTRRSFVLRCLRWWSFRRFLTALAWAITLVVLFFIGYLWFGQRAWEDYKKKLTARGENLDWAAFIPFTVPDKQNFGLTPLLASVFDYRWDPSRSTLIWRDPEAYGRITNFARSFGWPTAENTIRDLILPVGKSGQSNSATQLMRNKAAVDILAALKEYDPILDELRHASLTYSQSRFPIHYEEGPFAMLPHLDFLNRAAQILRLRASAELELAQTDLAFQDVRLILYLANSVRNEPFLPSQNTRRTELGLVVHCLYEGLEKHFWRKDQLQEIQGELQRIDLLREFEIGLRAERVRRNQMIDLARETRSPAFLWSTGDESTLHNSQPALLLRLVPSGWFYKNQTEYNRIFQESVLSGIDGKTHRLFPQRIDQNAKLETRTLTEFSGWLIHHRFIAAQFLASAPIRFMEMPFAHTQVLLDHALIACELEEYRLAHHELPDQLSQLDRGLQVRIPNDIFTGEPYKYRRLSSSQFGLYSVGWNGKDDDGIYRGNVKPNDFRKLPAQQRKDDWSWGHDEFEHLPAPLL
jgi:hypothetical protein